MYIHIYITSVSPVPLCVDSARPRRLWLRAHRGWPDGLTGWRFRVSLTVLEVLVLTLLLGLYKILLYFEAFEHDSIILLSPPPTCIGPTIATRVHDYCAIYDALPTPLLYAIHHTTLVIAISCKGQAVAALPGPEREGGGGSINGPGSSPSINWICTLCPGQF